MTLRATIIGAGAIGLGLLRPWLLSNGAEVTTVNRVNYDSPKPYRDLIRNTGCYTVRQPSKSREFDSVKLLEYDPADTDSEGYSACCQHVARGQVVLVSVGVSNLQGVAKLLTDAASVGSSEPLTVVAFENCIDAGGRLRKHMADCSSAYGKAVARPVRVLSGIVDRASEEPIIDGDKAVVKVEHFGEVILPAIASEVLPTCGADGCVPLVRTVAPEHFTLYEHRKFWFVNGTHVALGVLSLHGALNTFHVAHQDPHVNSVIQQLHQEWARILSSVSRSQGCSEVDFDQAQLVDYGSKVWSRVADIPTWTQLHVLREMVELPKAKPEAAFYDLRRALEKIDDRLGQPVRKASQLGVAGGAPTSSALHLLALQCLRDYADRFHR